LCAVPDDRYRIDEVEKAQSGETQFHRARHARKIAAEAMAARFAKLGAAALIDIKRQTN
jgi:uncharacterized protein YbjQ (UPF0145 family)